MVQRTVLKVQLSCDKCKKKILRSISGIQGVDKIEIDAAKETLTVTGDADPYAIIVQARKAIKVCVQVVTVGPPPPPPKKPVDEPIIHWLKPPIHMPQDCIACPQMAVVHMTDHEDPYCTTLPTTCSIM